MKNQKLSLILTFMAITLSMMAQPKGIKYEADSISLNGDDWSGMKAQLEQLKKSKSNDKFTIVHIGDSHVQPGIISDEVRHALQQRYGNGGRGLVCPLELARTNQPDDIELISTASIAESSILLLPSRPAGMGMTGVAVKFAGSSTILDICTKQKGDDFDRITLFHTKGKQFEVAQSRATIKGHKVSNFATNYKLRSLTDSVSLKLRGNGALFGVRLLNNKPGVVMDCIGNNGATFASYLSIDGFGQQLKDLDPQLVIISLGTNEAYGKTSSLESNINALISKIKTECPNVKFLLTTPIETHKKGRHGYVTQSGIIEVRKIIMDYAKKNNIPTWDFYTVAGGKGAARKWLASQHMSSDHLHLLKKGYHFMGNLLAKAFIKMLDNKPLETQDERFQESQLNRGLE